MLIDKLKESKPGINDLVTVNFFLSELRSLIALIEAAQELKSFEDGPTYFPKEDNYKFEMCCFCDAIDGSDANGDFIHEAVCPWLCFISALSQLEEKP